MDVGDAEGTVVPLLISEADECEAADGVRRAGEPGGACGTTVQAASQHKALAAMAALATRLKIIPCMTHMPFEPQGDMALNQLKPVANFY